MAWPEANEDGVEVVPGLEFGVRHDEPHALDHRYSSYGEPSELPSRAFHDSYEAYKALWLQVERIMEAKLEPNEVAAIRRAFELASSHPTIFVSPWVANALRLYGVARGFRVNTGVIPRHPRGPILLTFQTVRDGELVRVPVVVDRQLGEWGITVAQGEEHGVV